jgi:hypothetical protein
LLNIAVELDFRLVRAGLLRSADSPARRATNSADGVEQFRLRFKFPSDELLDVRIARAQLLDQLDIES